MNHIAKHVSNIFNCPNFSSAASLSCKLQQLRGIRVKVINGNLEQALAIMQRKMKYSGIERLLKQNLTYHLKNSQKRVLARKRLEQRIQSEDIARKLQAVLIKKVRGI